MPTQMTPVFQFRAYLVAESHPTLEGGAPRPSEGPTPVKVNPAQLGELLNLLQSQAAMGPCLSLALGPAGTVTVFIGELTKYAALEIGGGLVVPSAVSRN